MIHSAAARHLLAINQAFENGGRAAPPRFARRVLATLSLMLLYVMMSAASAPGWARDAIAECVGAHVDPGASMLTVLHTSELKFDRQGHAETRVRLVVKFLKRLKTRDAGVVEHEDNERRISDLRGWLISPSGRERELAASDVARISVSEIEGYFDESHLLVAMFGDAGPGDVAAFEYTAIDEKWSASYQTFEFQEQEPVHFAKFTVAVPKGWRWTSSAQNSEPLAHDSSAEAHYWIARDLPFRPEEPLMPPWTYLARRISVSIFEARDSSASLKSHWNRVARWVSDLVDPQVVVDDAVSSQAATLVRGMSGTVAKLRAIADFARDKIRYVAVELGQGRWQPRPSTKSCADRFGDCKDKVTLMRALLRAAGIPSSLVLANSSYPVDRGLASPFQFNHAIIAIPISALDSVGALSSAMASGRLFFDPTDEVCPLGQLPVQLQGAEVLVASPVDSEIVDLPYAKPEQNHRTIRAHAFLHDDGTLDADFSLVDRGLRASYTRYAYRTFPADEKRGMMLQLLSPSLVGPVISGELVKDLGDSIIVSFHVAAAGAAQSSGNSVNLSPALVAEKQVPALTQAKREFPIWFGGPRLQDVEIEIDMPRGWQFGDDQLLAKTDSCRNIARISYALQRSGAGFLYTFRWRNSGHLLWPEEYEDAKAFGKRVRSFSMFTMLGTRP